MMSLLKRLRNDRRGNVLVIAGAALPLILGSVGLATDTVQWTLWKRQLQRAADSAAFAGVYARFDDRSSLTAVNRDLVNNNHLWVPLMSGYPDVDDLPDAPGQMNTVNVELRVQQALSFSSMFMSSAPVIIANARAAAVEGDDFCVVGLDPSTTVPAVTIQGSTNVNMGCGIISNSRHPVNSVNPNGTSYTIVADPVAGAGAVPNMPGVNTESYHLPQPDPYEGKYSTEVPASVASDCGNMNSHVVSTAAGVTTLEPGCYSGGNAFKFTGGTTHLNPGVYYLNNADFDAQGGTITGTGVTIILTGTNPGTIKTNGNATIQLTAPTDATCGTFGGVNSCDYENMLIIQSTNATDSPSANNTINGTASSFFDGAFYFPNQQLNFTGSSGNMTKCAMIVARRVNFSGNANIQNNTVGCTANTQVTGWEIRLIA